MKKLQIGAFDQGVEGWINTDITPHLFVAKIPALAFLMRRAGLLSEHRYQQHRLGIFARLRYLNVARRFPFDAATFDCAYTSHMLEHLNPRDADHCLCEIHRVLKPGGVLRIAVPDLDQFMKKYVREAPEAFLEKFFESNHTSAKNMHHWHYNEFSLRRSLEHAGFRAVSRESFRHGHCPDLDRIECREESLFMEAVR
jgi:predicted SAM-dependent methyltransferase